MNLSIIDGDSISYICSKETIEESLKNTDGLIKSILGVTKADNYILALSKGKYFRHDVNKEYKGNRKPTTLKFTKTIQNYLYEQYGGVHMQDIEADDLVGLLATKYSGYGSNANITICAMDKDVLGQIPGTHFNYRNFEFITTTVDDSYRFLMKQILMGDSTDNIKGIPGIGPKKASSILEGVPLEEMLFTVCLQYIDYYKDSDIEAFHQFLKNYRQVYILKKEFDLYMINNLTFEELPEPIDNPLNFILKLYSYNEP